ncbi:hypothetical protein V2J09_001981 [Rumex salicifolius]
MASNSNDKTKLHVAMLPWLAFGHMIPWLELAKLLSDNNIKVSFISTPRNLKRLPKLPPKHTSITFVDFTLPSVNGLPETAEATSDLPYHQVGHLKLAYDKLQPQLKNFLEASSPDWLFVDFATYWAPPIATGLGIPSAFFSIFTASTLAYVGPPGPLIGEGPDTETRKTVEDFIVNPPWVPFESNVAFRYFEISKMLEALNERNISGVADFERFGLTARGCSAIAVRSCYELEPRELKLLEEICQLPVIPVGQLPPDTRVDREEDLADTWRVAREWLDKREKSSVVYVAFGSEATFDRQELAELALGLEASGFSFFWVLRSQKDELPEGFEERTKERGMIWTSWAPQLKILSHDSVVGMLSHSGWSSVVETVSLGKPLVLFTMYADQGLNAKVLETHEMAYVVPRDEKDGSFTREAVAESLRLVLVGEEGKVYREKVKEMSGVIGDIDRQMMYTNKLVSYLQTHKK